MLRKYGIGIIAYLILLALVILAILGTSHRVNQLQSQVNHQQRLLNADTNAIVTLLGDSLNGPRGTHVTSSTPLIYECSAQPCTNSQEFEVFDGYGNPIFSVGEYGGPAVFGDNTSGFAPGSVYYPAWVMSYTSPVAYLAAHPGDTQAQHCKAPAVWMAPGPSGLLVWHCYAGAWTK